MITGQSYQVRDFSKMQGKLFLANAFNANPWWPDIARRLRLSMTTTTVQTDPDGEVRELTVVTVP